MFSYIWPVALVVLSNVVYQVSAKSAPQGMDPLASLTVTYLVGAAASAALYFALSRGGNIAAEYAKLNWAPFALGVSVVGLEVGFICAYRAGWQLGTLSIVQSAILALALIAVGYFLYGEKITWNKAVGMAVCLAGLALINWK